MTLNGCFVMLALWLMAGSLDTASAAGAGRSDAALPVGTRVLREIPYGEDSQQRFDVYVPPSAHDAPVLFIVHGGSWAHGDKDHPGLIGNKAKYWLPRGYVIISTNYRLLPDADPKEQARDVANALAVAQGRAMEWNADAERFVMIGHSAGAHLVSLLAARPELLTSAKAVRPVGAISLDSAAMDVVRIMQAPRHPQLYDRAFGKEPAYWRETSPYHALSGEALPMLAVCSTRIAAFCAQAQAFAEKAELQRVRVEVLPQNLSHMEVNRKLGEPSRYTDTTAAFIRSLLDAAAAPAKAPRSTTTAKTKAP